MARLYDIRRLKAPLATMATARPVSYVRFMGKSLVNAVINSTLQTRRVSALLAGDTSVVREYSGHQNARHFVGLTCCQGGYVFTGSETNEVVMYHESVSQPLMRQRMVAQDAMGIVGAGEKNMVNCLAVAPSLDLVVAGGTTGWFNVLRLQRV
jgi:hypothetical protein